MTRTPESLFRLAESSRESLQAREAIASYTAAEEAGYDADICAAGRWTCWMLAGEWELAWRESDAIAARGSNDPHSYWDGSSWQDKDVLIRCLHGLGDTLQFIRFAPLIRQQARSVTIEAQPKLKSLLQQAGIADQVITWGEPEPTWQVQIEVNELPRLFRVTPGTVGMQEPYLRLPQVPAAADKASHLNVGMIWAASDFDPTRNVPLAFWEAILALSGFRFVSLQAGEASDDRLPAHVIRKCGRETDILQVAYEMEKLDLILTVDTMNAHLAGALGCRTWLLLPFQCDWRWMLERRDTPWYPTMRLFRQPEAGNWSSVVEEVRSCLLNLAAEWRASRVHDPQIANLHEQ